MSSEIYTYPIADMDHRIAQMWVDDPHVIDNPKEIDRRLEVIEQRLGLKVFGVLDKKFTPQGVTRIRGYEASHGVVHTWPEYDPPYAHFDFLVCEDITLRGIGELLLKTFEPRGLALTHLSYARIIVETEEAVVYERIDPPKKDTANLKYNVTEYSRMVDLERAEQLASVDSHFIKPPAYSIKRSVYSI